MHVLVTAASKHGATAEIADFLAAEMNQCGIETTVLDPTEVHDLRPYDGVVIGSAVYTGYWLKTATAMVARHRKAFGGKKVWLFSSGPVGDPPEPPGEPFSIESVKKHTGATEHVVFGGAIDRSKLGFGEKAVVVALRVEDGDFRPWDDLRDWAHKIANELRAVKA